MNPATGALSAERFTFPSADGLRLAGRYFRAPSPRATLVVEHGHGEHSGRYAAFAETAAGRGFSTATADLRGHGESQGPRGHAPSWDALVSDLVALLGEAQQRSTGPLFLFGHSMGGIVVLDVALHFDRAPGMVRGVIVTAPSLQLAFRPAAWKVGLARVAARFLPALALPTGIPIERISRDPEVVRCYREDPLVHQVMSLGFYFDFLEAQRRILADARSLRIPTLLLHGLEDRIASEEGTRAFAQISGAEYVTFPGLFHEVLNEPDRGAVAERIFGWMEKRLTP